MQTIKKLKELFNIAVKDGAFPGATYGIAFPDKTYVDVVGNKALYPNIENNDVDTLYDMASLTKVICTTTCALKLIEEGKLRLYAPVTKYIPEFQHPDITVWNLMTHTSGLPEGLSKTYELKEPSEVWERIFKLELKYETGTKIHYSDVGYILMGKIIENISGLRLNEFAKKYVFDPLEMNDTGYLPTDIKRCAPTEKRDDLVYRGIVRGSVHDETAYALGGVAGHAGLFSTAKDMTHFIQMILNNGVYKGQRFLAKATIDVLYTPQVKETTGVMINKDNRSLGWINRGSASSAGEITSLNTILHTGFTGTNVWIDRDNQVGMVILSNRVHPTRNNGLHMDFRPRAANFLIAHIHEIKEEIND